MDITNPSKPNNTLGTLLKVVVGGVIVWNLLPPDWKENISQGIYQVSAELAAAKCRKAVTLPQKIFTNSTTKMVPSPH